jgi:hypothetical protein
MRGDEPAVDVSGVEVESGCTIVGQDVGVAYCSCVGGEEAEEVVGCVDEGPVGRW